MSLFLLLFTACARAPESPQASQDVLVVMLDTGRADRLATYGHSRDNSYQLSSLAEIGVVFADVTSPSSWTWPSHAALFTGKAPWVSGAHRSTNPESGLQLPGLPRFQPMRQDLPTLAERFSQAGYRTASHASNLFLDPSLGLTRGFGTAQVYTQDNQTVAAAIEEMRTTGDSPLFLFVNLMGAHTPTMVMEPVPWSAQHKAALMSEEGWGRRVLLEQFGQVGAFLHNQQPDVGIPWDVAIHKGEVTLSPEGTQAMRDLYDAELVRLDHALKALVGAWVQSGRELGIVAVVSDHGEHLGERQLFGHGTTTWPEVLHVPLVVAAPGRLPAGERVESPLALEDVYGGLLDLAGLGEGEGEAWREAIAGSPRTEPIQAKVWPIPYWSRNVGGEFEGPWQLYREGEEALVVRGDGSGALFDLAQDAGMQHDLGPERPERLAALMRLAEEAFPESATTAEGAVALPEEMVERLRALGYVSE